MHGNEYLRTLLTVGILNGQSGLPGWCIPDEVRKQDLFPTRLEPCFKKC